MAEIEVVTYKQEVVTYKQVVEASQQREAAKDKIIEELMKRLGLTLFSLSSLKSLKQVSM